VNTAESSGRSGSRISPATLVIASAASLVAAYTVSRFWGAGTLVGAAVTPIIVTLVSEALHRPAKAIGTVRETRGARRFDPLAEGRSGLREGDLEMARPSAAQAPDDGRSLHRVGSARARRRFALAVTAGLVAFGIAMVVLTGSELVLGDSAISSGDRRTTVFGGQGAAARDSPEPAKTETTEQPPPEEAPPGETNLHSPDTQEPGQAQPPAEQPPAPEGSAPAQPAPPTTPALDDATGGAPAPAPEPTPTP
jgi:hypothetical protein